MKGFFGRLKLEGASAAIAVDCMRKERDISPVSETNKPLSFEVNLSETGKLEVDEIGDKGVIRSTMIPSDGKAPALLCEREVEATGDIAESVRKKSVSCAIKAVGITP